MGGIDTLDVERLGDLGTLLAVHGEADVAHGRYVGRAHVEDRRSDIVAFTDLLDVLDPDRIAGEVEGAVLLAIPLQQESGGFAHCTSDLRVRGVHGRHSRHTDLLTALVGELRRFPGCQRLGVSAQHGRCVRRGQYPAPLGKHSLPGVVQIVEVVSVAQEDGVDPADFFCRDRRCHDLLQIVAGALALLRALGVEARIGDEPEGADLDEIGSSTEVGQLGIHFNILLLCFNSRAVSKNHLPERQRRHEDEQHGQASLQRTLRDPGRDQRAELSADQDSRHRERDDAQHGVQRFATCLHELDEMSGRSEQGRDGDHEDTRSDRDRTRDPTTLQQKIPVQLAKSGGDHPDEQPADTGDDPTLRAIAHGVAEALPVASRQAGFALVAPKVFLDVPVHPLDVLLPRGPQEAEGHGEQPDAQDGLQNDRGDIPRQPSPQESHGNGHHEQCQAKPIVDQAFATVGRDPAGEPEDFCDQSGADGDLG